MGRGEEATVLAPFGRKDRMSNSKAAPMRKCMTADFVSSFDKSLEMRSLEVPYWVGTRSETSTGIVRSARPVCLQYVGSRLRRRFGEIIECE